MSTTDASTPAANQSPAADDRLVAVIDIGTTSIRMMIAQIDKAGNVQPLEHLHQAVELGKDTFTSGNIGEETMEKCVAALRSFQRILREYRITDPTRVRAVATNAVREATNREAFLDRIQISTGIAVDDIDDAEVHRYTFLGIKPILESEVMLRAADLVVVEVGGGSTRVLGLQSGLVALAISYRLGSLRLREMLEDFHAPAISLPDLLENHVQTTVSQIQASLPFKGKPNLLLLGGDARFVADSHVENWDKRCAARVKVTALARTTEKILKLSVDSLVKLHHLSYPDAETLGPALLTYTRLAQALKVQHVYVASTSLREGLMAEMAHDAWTDEFMQQIVHSATELGRKYNFEQRHAESVTRIARQVFSALRAEHHLTVREERILTVASLLHEIGLFVSNRNHHKHSMYLIQNSEVFGLGDRDTQLAALVARYHRRATPRSSHEEFIRMDRVDRLTVSKLASILRLADALDRRHCDFLRDLDIRLESGRLLVTARNTSDLVVEHLGLQQKGPMFQQLFGLAVVLQAEPPHQ
jgi:exopolyphosphatase/guanosine-5'-triphosphate,3'-diphosphate pyrophosphatase